MFCNDRNENISFLTWNIYLGTDIGLLVDVQQDALLERISEVFQLFLATNFQARAKAIAEEIASKRPDIIGLQEAVQCSLNIEPFGLVVFDFIDILLHELKRIGISYQVTAINENFLSPALPDRYGNLIQLQDRDAILIRKDSKLKLIRKQIDNFKTNLMITVAGQLITIQRGWSSIDVLSKGKVFRVVNTHLEPVDERVRIAQVRELLGTPANTSLPVVILGDLNDIPKSVTLNLFNRAEFKDLWSEVGKGDGFTCCQAPDLLNPNSLLNQRVDYILFKNGWKALKANVVGEGQNDRTETGLWPSDHTGVFGGLSLKNHHHKSSH
ncbi:endonuclease/exonuclease/phosphatase family protein [Ureibacillus sp. NPDC094379]